MALKFNSKYNHTRQDGITFDDPSLTEQQFAYETDINNIVNGIVAKEYNVKPPLYGQVISPDQYDEALNILANAKSQFAELPSEIRTKFHNDPKELLAYCQDDKNYDEGVKLGLFAQKVVKEPIEVVISKSETDVTVDKTATQNPLQE